jgi:two-component sensor histidine kinase
LRLGEGRITTESKLPHHALTEDAEFARLRQQLVHANERIAELQHVIRDTSQVALGVVSIIASRHSTAEAKVLAKEIRLRLGAIGVAIADAADGVVDVSSCIGKLARETASVFGRPRIGQRLDLAPVHVHERAAVSIALIAIELVSNAYRHAFADRPFGAIDIRLARVGDRWASLSVADNGIGVAPEIAANWPRVLPGGRHCGLATALGLAQGLGGQLRLQCNGGTTVELSFPAG